MAIGRYRIMTETRESKVNWVTDYHFHLLKVNALIPETRTFISRCAETHAAISVDTAIRERWFGNRSDARVKNFLQVFNLRYRKYGKVFDLLLRYHQKFTLADWQVVVLVHLLVSDPFFRWFVSEFLAKIPIKSPVSTQALFRSLNSTMPDHIRSNTRVTYAMKLITAAKAVGLIDATEVNQTAHVSLSLLSLYYMLYFLESINMDPGDFLQSPLAKPFDAQMLTERLESGHQLGYWHLTWYGNTARIQLADLNGVPLD